MIMKAAVLIAASGRGLRMGGDIKKQYLTLAGRPVLARSLQVFISHPAVQQIVVIVPKNEIDLARETIKPFCALDKICFVEGGRRRQDSIYQGLLAISGDAAMVCIHDGVRPLVSSELFESVLEAACRYGAAIPVVPVTDTLKEVSFSGMVGRTIPRETIRRAQTPQIFRHELISEAYRKAHILGVEATDDAYLLELVGEAVNTVPGSPSNIKITSPQDLLFAEALLKGGR